jgi:hypothetical protein
MELKKITLKDKKIFHKFLSFSRHRLAVYAFTNIYIWKDLFDIRWKVIDDGLCIFFTDRIGCFLYLPPLAKKLNPRTPEEAFRIMDKFNRNPDISRIENVEVEDLPLYRSFGYGYQEKYSDYLCLRKDLAHLKGNRFKSKRACFNYFAQHYNFTYQPFSLKEKNACLELYSAWLKERGCKHQDSLYQGMLRDAQACLKVLLDNYAHLDCLGRLVKIDKKIKAFTFGYRINADTFAVLFEIADLSFKGLSQFIFRELCRELAGYKYINIMDDSGLENLKRVKLSYHPAGLIPNYIVKRQG